MYCAALAVEFDRVVESLQGTIQPFALAKVDCEESGKETCLAYSISVYDDPILKIFRKGQLGQDYDGTDDAGMFKPKLISDFNNKYTTLDTQ